MTPRQFEAEMREWGRKNVPLIGKAVHSQVSQAVYKGIVQKTPVLTGRARFNWFPTLGAPSDTAVNETANVSVTGQPQTPEEISRINAVVQKLKVLPLGEQKVYITNNQPYIQGLEDGTISQKTPPNAMVQGTIINTLDGLKVTIKNIGVG